MLQQHLIVTLINLMQLLQKRKCGLSMSVKFVGVNIPAVILKKIREILRHSSIVHARFRLGFCFHDHRGNRALAHEGVESR